MDSKTSKYPRNKYVRCIMCLVNKHSHPSRRFYNFPKDPSILKKWLAVCPHLIEHTPEQLKTFQVCSSHFLDSDYASCRKQRLRKIAYPKLYKEISVQSLKEKLSTVLNNIPPAPADSIKDEYPPVNKVEISDNTVGHKDSNILSSTSALLGDLNAISDRECNSFTNLSSATSSDVKDEHKRNSRRIFIGQKIKRSKI